MAAAPGQQAGTVLALGAQPGCWIAAQPAWQAAPEMARTHLHVVVIQLSGT